MIVRVVVFVIALLLFTHASAEQINFTSNNNYLGNISPTRLVLNDKIKIEYNGTHMITDNWFVNYESSAIYKISPSEKSLYTFYLLSDYTKVGFVIIDATDNRLTEVGQAESKRRHRRHAAVTLDPSGDYYLIIGSGSTEEEVPFTLYAYKGNEEEHDIIRINGANPLSAGKTKFVLRKQGQRFEGMRAIYFDVAALKKRGKWLTITTGTPDQDTVLYLLDAWNRVVSVHDDISIKNKNSELHVSPESSGEYVAATLFKEPEEDNVSLSLYLKTSDYDPREGVVGAFNTYIANPAISFILGVILSILIAWFFYVRSLFSKVLKYKETLDHLMIAEHRKSPLRFVINGEEIKCASLYKFLVKNSGRARIEKKLVVENIQLVLSNIEKIIDIDFDVKGCGWRVPDLINDNTVKLDFDYIDPNDSIELTIICKQIPEAANLKVGHRLLGNISETVIKPFQTKPPLVMLMLDACFGLLMLALTPILLLDIAFNFMPEWWAVIWVKYVPMILIFVIGYHFATEMGRQRIKATISLVKSTIPRIVAKG